MGEQTKPDLRLPDVLALFPLSGAIVLPRSQLPLNVFEPRYLALVDDALKSDRMIGIIQPQSDSELSARPPLYEVGAFGRITAFAETDDGPYLITLTGISRFKILRELSVMTPYRQAQVTYDPFPNDGAPEPEDPSLDRPKLLAALRRYFTANRIESDWDAIQKAPAEALVNSLSMIAPVQPAEKQALLEASSVAKRAGILITLIELALANQPLNSESKPN